MIFYIIIAFRVEYITCVFLDAACLLEASMACCRLLVDSEHVSIDSLLDQGYILTAIASIMLSPNLFQQVGPCLTHQEITGRFIRYCIKKRFSLWY